MAVTDGITGISSNLHHLPDAYKTAKHRAKQTQKRYRLVDERGRLLDLVEP